MQKLINELFTKYKNWVTTTADKTYSGDVASKLQLSLFVGLLTTLLSITIALVMWLLLTTVWTLALKYGLLFVGIVFLPIALGIVMAIAVFSTY